VATIFFTNYPSAALQHINEELHQTSFIFKGSHVNNITILCTEQGFHFEINEGYFHSKRMKGEQRPKVKPEAVIHIGM
jgi:hypothetical protein